VGKEHDSRKKRAVIRVLGLGPHYLDMVGVTGSIPVAPTINPRHFLFFGKVLAPVGAMAQVDGERARA
jgi:hypothetical protein